MLGRYMFGAALGGNARCAISGVTRLTDVGNGTKSSKVYLIYSLHFNILYFYFYINSDVIYNTSRVTRQALAETLVSQA